MKVIGFVGSPHKGGNTAFTVNKILEGASEHGAKTEVFYSSELDISPCKGCLGCVKSGVCVLNDDMQRIYDALKTADALVLGSPIYMGQMTAQAKIFTDRLFAQISPRFSPKFKEENAGKKLILVFTQGNPNAAMFKEYIDYTEKMFNLLEFDIKDLITVSGIRTKPVSEMAALHGTLKTAGSSMLF